MSKRYGIAFFAFLFLVSGLSFAEYNKTDVVKVMRNTMTLMSEIKTAIGKNDFASAEKGFASVAAGMGSIKKFTPYRGKKTDWDATIDAFVSAARKGETASKEKHPGRATEALNELWKLNQTGHSAFK